jgi:hypothetical protein
MRTSMNLTGTWHANVSTPGTTYDVLYRYSDGKHPTEWTAAWTADLTKSKVKIQNREAKSISCIDVDD